MLQSLLKNNPQKEELDECAEEYPNVGKAILEYHINFIPQIILKWI